MVVPHQRQPLQERVGREEHPVEPPRLEPPRVGGAARRVAEQLGRRREVGRNAFGAALAGEHAVDGRVGAVGQVALELGPGRGEAGPAAERPGPLQVPGAAGLGR